MEDEKKMKLINVSLVVIGWSIILILTGTIGQNLGYFPSFVGLDMLPNYGNRVLTAWAQFDGVYYLTIAEKGYKSIGLIQAFFPLYPLLIRLLSFGVLNEVMVGIFISTVSFIGALYLLYKLIALDEPKLIAKKSLMGLMLFPTAFFFIALYTESLFLFLVVASFYAARKNKWWLAGCLGCLAGATRLVGGFLFPALLYEYWLQYRRKISLTILFCLGPLLGLLGYMAYLQFTFSDPLLFYHVQASFGGGRTNTGLILLPQVFFRYIKMMTTTSWTNPIYPVLIQEFLAGIIGLTGIIYGWLKLRKSYMTFAVGAFLLPTLTGTFSSMPRYLLPLFPIFLVAGKYLPKRAYLLMLTLSLGLLVYNVIRFAQGLWVA